jgi:hypothetical protein
VPLRTSAFGCKISKSRNVVKISIDVKIKFTIEVH